MHNFYINFYVTGIFYHINSPPPSSGDGNIDPESVLLGICISVLAASIFYVVYDKYYGKQPPQQSKEEENFPKDCNSDGNSSKDCNSDGNSSKDCNSDGNSFKDYNLDGNSFKDYNLDFISPDKSNASELIVKTVTSPEINNSIEVVSEVISSGILPPMQ